MAGRPAKRKPAKKRRKQQRLALPRLPQLEQHHLDVIGLGLVAAAAFFSLVFFFGWDGGKVGEAFADGFVFLFGGVAYLVPVALFGIGAVTVLRPMLPSVRPFKAGAICIMTALLLGLAAGSLGLGPDSPARKGEFAQRAYFEEHGGVVGEALFWVARTLFSTTGAHIIFVFLLLAGILLLTGASIAGVVASTRESVSQTTRRIRKSTHDFAAVVTGRDEPEEPTVRVPEVEPVVRATHVEAPSAYYAELDDEPEPEPEPAPQPEAEPAPEPDPVTDDVAVQDLTPMGNRRSGVTESEEIGYQLPKPTLLKRGSAKDKADPKADERIAHQLIEALSHFGIESQVVGTVVGPHVTRYELRLAPGTKMAKVSGLRDDLAYALAAQDVRILAPIPGRQAVGVEVPNRIRKMVHLADVLHDAPADWSPLYVFLGKDIGGKSIGTDLARQPHILIAGTTGSGKSGCVNAMLSSILLRATPNDVRLVLVDPKQVELNHYEAIPHLLTPVITSPRLAANALQNLIREMEQRYSLMAPLRARNIVELNKIRLKQGEPKLPYILCVIDELADLMMIAPHDVEDSIIRLAQKARAVGIHLVLATQRPSADVITGLIKANVPSRIAFAVSSQTDSRVILDQNGAESLLGQGDMLFRPVSESKTARIQGAFISEEEIEKLTAHWRRQGEPELHEELLEAVEPAEEEGRDEDLDPDSDDLLGEAIATVVQMGTASTSMLQRRLRVGYTRAGRLIDMMERRGVISGYEGSKARQVLVTEADLPRVLAALEEPTPATG